MAGTPEHGHDDLPALRAAWDAAVRSAGGDPGAAGGVFDELAAAYAGPGRPYHNLDHLADVLRQVDALASAARDPTAVRLAAWFHDAVYDPRAADNEERSADLAGAALARLGVPGAAVSEVRRLVLLTKAHRVEAGDADGCVLLDADLAILGAEAERYRAYADAIRREYAWVPDDAYRAGRAKVLRGFLNREWIYNTPPMRERREGQARQNIATELLALEGADAPAPPTRDER